MPPTRADDFLAELVAALARNRDPFVPWTRRPAQGWWQRLVAALGRNHGESPPGTVAARTDPTSVRGMVHAVPGALIADLAPAQAELGDASLHRMTATDVARLYAGLAPDLRIQNRRAGHVLFDTLMIIQIADHAQTMADLLLAWALEAAASLNLARDSRAPYRFRRRRMIRLGFPTRLATELDVGAELADGLALGLDAGKARAHRTLDDLVGLRRTLSEADIPTAGLVDDLDRLHASATSLRDRLLATREDVGWLLSAPRQQARDLNRSELDRISMIAQRHATDLAWISAELLEEIIGKVPRVRQVARSVAGRILAALPFQLRYEDVTIAEASTAELLALKEVLDNFAGADLKDADLSDVSLVGVRWSAATRWPQGWHQRVQEDSVPIGSGRYVVQFPPASPGDRVAVFT